MGKDPDRLRRLMFERGIESAAELGRRIGVTGQTVTRWLAGAPIPEAQLRALGAELGVNWMWLGWGEETGLTPAGEQRDDSALGQARRELIRRALNNERRLRVAQQLTGFGAWDVDVLTGALNWDERTHELFGLPPERAPKTPAEFFAMVWPEDRRPLEEGLADLLANPGVTYRADHRYTPPNGTVRWFRQIARLTRDEADRPACVIGACLDITEEKRAAAMAARYERIREHMMDSYAETCLDGTILDVTDGCLRHGGWKRADLVGKNIRDFYVDPGQRDTLLAALQARGKVRDFPATLRTQAGGTIDVLFNVRLVREPDGHAFLAGTMRPANHPPAGD